MLGLCAGLSHGPPGKEAAAGPSFNCPKKQESKSQTQIAIEIPCNNEEEHPGSALRAEAVGGVHHSLLDKICLNLTQAVWLAAKAPRVLRAETMVPSMPCRADLQSLNEQNSSAGAPRKARCHLE